MNAPQNIGLRNRLLFMGPVMVNVTIFFIFIFFTAVAHAQLAVTVTPVKVIGQKAIVELAMTNNLATTVKSARAICFLMNNQGKMVGESSRWVIGGAKTRPALEPQTATSYNFVITARQPFTSTNLTAKVSFSRVVLEGEKLASPRTAVQIQNAR
jgi:ABC-type uncharacterized transport system permease subunit